MGDMARLLPGQAGLARLGWKLLTEVRGQADRRDELRVALAPALSKTGTGLGKGWVVQASLGGEAGLGGLRWTALEDSQTRCVKAPIRGSSQLRTSPMNK